MNRSPSVSPGPGSYQWTASYSGDPNNLAVGPVGCGVAAEQVTVPPAPALSTTASAADKTGAIFDTAHLTGGSGPTGSITFRLYAAGDTGCATALKTVSSAVSGDGDYV